MTMFYPLGICDFELTRTYKLYEYCIRPRQYENSMWNGCISN